MREGVQHDVLESALAGNPLDVLDEFRFQITWPDLVLRFAMDEDDGCVNDLHFAIAVACVRQRFLKRTERKLLGQEHQGFHGISPLSSLTPAISPGAPQSPQYACGVAPRRAPRWFASPVTGVR